MKDVNMEEFKEMQNRLDILQRARSLAIKSGISRLLHLKPDDYERISATKSGAPDAVRMELDNVFVHAILSSIDSDCVERIARKTVAVLTETIERHREQMIVKLAFDEDDQPAIDAFDDEGTTEVFNR